MIFAWGNKEYRLSLKSCKKLTFVFQNLTPFQEEERNSLMREIIQTGPKAWMYFFVKMHSRFYTLCCSGIREYEYCAELYELSSLVTLKAGSGCACTLDYAHSCEEALSSPLLDFIKALWMNISAYYYASRAEWDPRSPGPQWEAEKRFKVENLSVNYHLNTFFTAANQAEPTAPHRCS